MLRQILATRRKRGGWALAGLWLGFGWGVAADSQLTPNPESGTTPLDHIQRTSRLTISHDTTLPIKAHDCLL